MTTHLSVNINQDSAAILRWAELEHNRTPQDVLAIGTFLLELIDGSVQLQLIDSAGEIEEVYEISPSPAPDVYYF